MHLCISAFLAWARPSLGLLSGEGKNIEYTLLHSDSVLSTFLLLASFPTFPLTACRSIKLQEPFAPGSFPHLYWSTWPSTGTIPWGKGNSGRFNAFSAVASCLSHSKWPKPACYFPVGLIGYFDTWHLKSLQLSSALDKKKGTIVWNPSSVKILLKVSYMSNDKCPQWWLWECQIILVAV